MVVRAVAAAARSLGLAGRSVLVAASGGVDSTVLAHALAACREPLGLTVVLGHVNHGLRGADADLDEAAVRALGARLGLEVCAMRVEPGRLREGRSSRARPSLQEAARRARYDALRALAAGSGAAHVATAHTLDDQAETVLLRLLRGSGPDGLGGIPERSADGFVVRPLLAVPRRAVERYARDTRLTWREDPSNGDPRFARGRLRSGGLAELAAALNPRWLRALGDLAEAQRRDAEWIGGLVDDEARRRFREERPGDAPDSASLRIARDGWAALPEGLARRLARRALRAQGGARDVSRTHLERMVVFLRSGRPGARLGLPGGLELACQRDGFLLRRVGVRPGVEC
jgi:tRNA(Ile)-lysidine synthase